MSALQDLSGKVAVVTGGASGIGRGIAAALLAEGMRVVIADVEEGALQATASELGAVGVRTDVSDLQSVESLAAAVRDRYGRVDVVCNNAGIGGSARIVDLTPSDWRWTLDVNLWGVIHGVQVFLPILLANPDGGHIVNTASMSGLISRTGLGAYNVSKYGVVALSETLAGELAEDGSKVGVSVLCPGFVRTNIGAYLRNRPQQFADGALGRPDVTTTSSASVRAAAERFHRIEPEEAGAMVVDAIKHGDLYILTDPEMSFEVEERFQHIKAAFEKAAARGAAAGDRP